MRVRTCGRGARRAHGAYRRAQQQARHLGRPVVVAYDDRAVVHRHGIDNVTRGNPASRLLSGQREAGDVRPAGVNASEAWRGIR